MRRYIRLPSANNKCRAMTKRGTYCRKRAELGAWCLEHHPALAIVERAGGIPLVFVVEETPHQWAIRCPYCHKLHYHGKGEGHRVAHCLNKTAENVGYIVKQP